MKYGYWYKLPRIHFSTYLSHRENYCDTDIIGSLNHCWRGRGGEGENVGRTDKFIRRDCDMGTPIVKSEVWENSKILRLKSKEEICHAAKVAFEKVFKARLQEYGKVSRAILFENFARSKRTRDMGLNSLHINI